MKKLPLLKRISDLFPWTPLGVTVVLVSFGTLKWFAYRQLDLVLLVISYGGLLAAAACALLVCAVAIWLKIYWWRLGGPSSSTLLLETGVTQATGFSLPALAFVPLIRIRWSWLLPIGVQTQIDRERGRLKESVTVAQRGQFRRVRRRIAVSDTLGLSQIAFSIDEPMTMDVLPYLGNLKRVPELLSMANGDQMPFPTGSIEGDRFELQRYMPGDPARFIHWKVFGRTRKLMTRHPERSQAPLARVAAFFIAGAQDDATAAVARLAVENGLLGANWLFGTDEDLNGTSDKGAALALLLRSALTSEQSGSGARAFFSLVDKSGPARSLVFVPPVLGPWMRYLFDLANDREFSAIIGVDPIGARPQTPWWQNLFTKPTRLAGVTGEQLQEVLRALSSVSCQLLVLDRKNGQRLGEPIVVESSHPGRVNVLS